MSTKKKLLLATNPAYWPSTGGSEMVLEKILQGQKQFYERIVVFTRTKDSKSFTHEGVEVVAYNEKSLRTFAKRNKPDVYFPNMAHSDITFNNIKYVSKHSKKTIVNIIGGYPKDTPLAHRSNILSLLQRYSDAAVHVDPISAEYLIDRAINPSVPYVFIPQGLNRNELDQARAKNKDTNPYYVYAHNLWSWKTPDIFINEVVARLPEKKFIIIASKTTGDVIEAVVRLAKKYPNLELKLGLGRSEFLSVLAGADGIISTSQIEGAQPNIMLEAGYLGVPYLSLCPGQNYGHYPHVEMYEDADSIAGRIGTAKMPLKDLKFDDLNQARLVFLANKYNWQNVIGEYTKLFVEEGSLHDNN